MAKARANDRNTSSSHRGTSSDYIISKAGRLFAERGYYNTSMDDIAATVGILKGSLYHHVSSKEEILDRVLAGAVQDLLVKSEAVSRSIADPESRLEEMMRIMVRNVHDSQHGNIVYATERHRLPKPLREKYRRLFARHRQLLESTVHEIVGDSLHGDGDKPQIDEGLAVTSIISLVSMMSLWYRPRGPLSITEIEAQFVRQARAILGLCQ